MQNFKRSDTRLPKPVLKDLGDYLRPGEEVIDVIHEAFIPAIDFRWVFLTSERVVIARRTPMSTHFRDINLSEMEIDFTKGIFYDIIIFQFRTDSYRGSFYRMDRRYTMEFLNLIKKYQDQLQNEEELSQSEAEVEPIQTLEDLAELRDRGIVSEEEFENAKKDFLKKFRKEKEEAE
jgi:hypothetical protein